MRNRGQAKIGRSILSRPGGFFYPSGIVPACFLCGCVRHHDILDQESVDPGIVLDQFAAFDIGTLTRDDFLPVCFGQQELADSERPRRFLPGFRCVGGTVVRLPVINSDFAGDASFDPDLTNLPPGGQIDPGSTWNFQYWFRDPVAGGANFDFTDAVQIDFCP